ncbi:uncharacterized protein LOC135950441 [Calliphora vicina]|uniref:uncharacterized protein LOC135950441 n=1 Tax=Calliphora vicina TaxID=7373 RepID=UPI00325BA41C
MSLLHSPQKTQDQAQCSTVDPPTTENLCIVCNENITETHEVLIINTCSHEFHRQCIENSLSQSSECPYCKCSCELADLVVKRLDIQPPKNSPRPKQGKTGKPRGAMAKKYHTRQFSRNLVQEFSQDASGSNALVPDERNFSPQNDQQAAHTSNNFEGVRQQIPQTNNNQSFSNNLDYSQINQMIENTITRLLGNLNILPHPVNQNIPTHTRPIQPSISLNNQYLQPPQHNNPSEPGRLNISGNQFIDSGYSLKVDKITAIIQNWNIKFDGSTKGLTVEEFLYRVRSLTTENFNGDFSIICKNLPMLLTGKARDWYWRGLGRTTLITHEIDVGDSKPIKQRFYPVSPAVEKLMYKEIDRMLELGVIEESTSAWSSPMRLVVKPNKIRLCLDARKLNNVTKKDAYPLPNIEGIFSRLPKANLISKLDLKDAYWQIGLADQSKALTAFTVPGRPLYQFVVMPFGLCTAPQTMCRLMDQLIPPDLRHCVFGYLDDLVIVSEDFQSHLTTLVKIADQFRRANLTLNIAKSAFCVTQVKYLGFVIGNGGIQTDPEKVEAIIKWPTPKNIKQVRGFLGIAGWYRRFIENFSTEVHPITETLSTKRKFNWTTEAQKSFEKIKFLLTTTPVLSNPDFTRKFYLHCDASDYGIGAVLVQLDDNGSEKPVAYMSKKLNTAQRNYSVTERECLAAIEAIKKFRCYLELQEFEVITDHSSLVWLMKQPDLTDPPSIEEITSAVRKLKRNKAPGEDGIPPELLQANPGIAAEIIHPYICDAWLNEQLPNTWTKGEIVKLPKKNDLTECDNWRGITLLNTVYKVIATIINNRLHSIEKSLRDEQAGFRLHRNCVDQANTLRVIIEQTVEW